MKKNLVLILNLVFITSFAQKSDFKAFNLSLPVEIAYYDNQFSGLYIYNEKLFMMSESRLQDHAEGKLYAMRLSDLDLKINDTSYILPFQKYPLYNLEKLRGKITGLGQNYEGLEAISISGDAIHHSVETDTPSPDCYLIEGKINDTAVIMNTEYLMAVAKPVEPDGSHIYNAGFEAIAMVRNQIFCFFEFNYFPSANYVYATITDSIMNNRKINLIPLSRIPFRVTDITQTGNNHFTAINYFYKGGGADAVYRIPDDDSENNRLIKNDKGYHSYCRLIDLEYSGNYFTWKPLWEFPLQYMDYNWEGIAAYKTGYFIINDKYTPKRPYQSTLLYIRPK